MGIAVDSHGNMWVANSGLIDVPCPNGSTPTSGPSGDSITLITSDHKTKQFNGGGLTIPWGIAVDGNDNVWVANFGQSRLSQFCGVESPNCAHAGAAISPDGTGYYFDGLVRNTGVGIDPSGNVWVTNNWETVPLQTDPGGHQMVVFIGLAAPVKAPLIGPPLKP
jgi:sugar lactone lactonase YvrE